MKEEAIDDGSGGERPEGFRRISAWLAVHGHPHPPVFLRVAARTAQEAADALGVAVGQIAKSVVFRRLADDAPVLVVTSGDRRVDEAKVAALVGGPLGRADARFVKSSTGFSIGGVAPIGHSTAPVALIDRDLFRFDTLWTAAGHPNGVFRLSPQALMALSGAPVADVVLEPVTGTSQVVARTLREPGGLVSDTGVALPRVFEPGTSPVSTQIASPCTEVCRMDAVTGWCEGCLRTIDEIVSWATLDDAGRLSVWRALDRRRAALGATMTAPPTTPTDRSLPG